MCHKIASNIQHTMASAIRTFVFLTLSATLLAFFAAEPARSDDLSQLGLSQLAELDVTSAGKKSQKLGEAAAAIFVITQDDIERSGARSIPEVLRLVPGLHVAQIDSQRWAITSRGINSAFANNLLVLMDNRTLYSPVFNGVFWDSQETFIEDIDRIEVIRGPGATLWGSNAVNGVINIITKSSVETEGTFAYGGGGNYHRGFAGVRYGKQIGETTTARGFFKWFDRGDFDREDGAGSAKDAWYSLRGGFHLDSDLTERDTLTVQGDVYRDVQDQGFDDLEPELSASIANVDDDEAQHGTNILARWTRTFSEVSDFQLQTYFDYVNRDDTILTQNVRTTDIEFQHRFPLFEFNDIVWGAGYRHIDDDLDGSVTVSYDPDNRSTDLYTWFVQDEIQLIKEKLKIIVGSKFEKNYYTDFEIQPNVRFVWIPEKTHSIWGAVSRAIHTPSRTENDLRVVSSIITPEGQRILTAGVGSDRVKGVDLTALELGYRGQLSEQASLDLTAFYFFYDDHLSAEPQSLENIEGVTGPVVFIDIQNKLNVESRGVELVLNLKPQEWWRMVLTYAFIDMSVFGSQSQDEIVFGNLDTDAPQHQYTVRSHMDLPYRLKVDGMLRFVDELSLIDSYHELDVRVAWSPSPGITLSVVGQNLLDDHVEWIDGRFGQAVTNISRGVYGKLSWEFG